MNQTLAIKLFDTAKSYCQKNASAELKEAMRVDESTFRNLKSKKFLAQYCWVIYASGFREAILAGVFGDLEDAFKGFDLERLARTRSIQPALNVFNNKNKANAFLRGSKLIAEEGFSAFKKRVRIEGVDALEKLPGIGPITKVHLAKNIGLLDVAKPDRWLERAAEMTSSTVDELVGFLSAKYQVSRHVVDLIIWRYAADNGLEKLTPVERVGRPHQEEPSATLQMASALGDHAYSGELWLDYEDGEEDEHWVGHVSKGIFRGEQIVLEFSGNSPEHGPFSGTCNLKRDGAHYIGLGNFKVSRESTTASVSVTVSMEDDVVSLQGSWQDSGDRTSYDLTVQLEKLPRNGA